MSDILGIEQSGGVLATIKAELEAASPSRRQRILEAIALAALGSIPWVGGVLSAAATFKLVRTVFDKMTFGRSGFRNINIDSKSCVRLWVGSSLA